MTTTIDLDLKTTLVPLAELAELLELTLEELSQPLSLLEKPLKLKPITIDEERYLEPLQAELLLSLKPLLPDPDALQDLLLALREGALIYKCRRCGTLRLTDQVLLGAELEHDCKAFDLRHQLPPTGRYQLIASGSLEYVGEWLQSLKLGLDNPLKGV